MSKKETELFLKGERYCRTLMVIMVAAYLLYLLESYLIFHSKPAGFMLFTIPALFLVCFGCRKIRWVYYFFAGMMAISGLICLFLFVVYLFRFKMIDDKMVGIKVALWAPFGLLHGVSIYFLARDPIKSYLEETSARRKQTKAKNKGEGRR